MTFKFESPEFKNLFKEVINIATIRKDHLSELPENVEKVVSVFKSIERVFPNDGDLSYLDEKITYSTKCDGFDFVELIKKPLTEFIMSNSKENFIRLIFLASSLIYIYLRELEFHVSGFNPVIGIEIGSFLTTIGFELRKEPNYSRYIDFGDRDIPFNILKEIFLSKEIRGLEDLTSKQLEINAKLDELRKIIFNSEESFVQKTQVVTELEKRLEKTKVTYDFLGLNKGFQQLYEQKKEELKSRRDGYSAFGAMLFFTPLCSIALFIFLYFSLGEEALKFIIYLALPITTFMIIVFYFVRVGLQHVRSVQSQMMQLELRMALCQFIHNYAEDSEKLHAKNKAGFEKFENIIFSPLVSSDDKIPTTFDGMEQLAKLVSEFRK